MVNIEQVIQEVQQGNTDKFELIIEKYQKQLFAYIYHMVDNINDAEDLLQDVFIAAYEKISTYRKSVSFSAWLYKIAYNKTINFLKRKKLTKIIDCFDFNRIEDKNQSFESNLDIDFDENIQSALSKLKPEDKNILILRILEDRSYEEISTVLNRKPSAIRKKFERARKRFIKYYEEFPRSDKYEKYPDRA